METNTLIIFVTIILLHAIWVYFAYLTTFSSSSEDSFSYQSPPWNDFPVFKIISERLETFASNAGVTKNQSLLSCDAVPESRIEPVAKLTLYITFELPRSVRFIVRPNLIHVTQSDGVESKGFGLANNRSSNVCCPILIVARINVRWLCHLH